MHTSIRNGESRQKVIAMKNEVIDCRRTEEEIRIKDSAIASSIVGIGLTDLEGNITYANNAALKMWKADDPSEVLGKSIVTLAQSEEEWLEILHTVLEKGGWSGETTAVRKDESPVVLYSSVNLVRNADGESICIMGSFVDITERKQMEEELRINDSAIASSIVGIGFTDLEGKITYANDAAVKMWGADDPSELLCKDIVMFAQSEDEGLELLRTVLEEGRWSGETTAVRKDQSPVVLHSSASLVRNADGESICIMGSFVDITQRKIAEQELQRAKDELEMRVEKRTGELRLKSLNLEEANTALKVLLKHREQDKAELEEKVLVNVKKLVLPYLEKLRNSRLDDQQMTNVRILESNIDDIISPFLKNLSSQYEDFTPTEIQVADLVKEGKSTKEIAEVLFISDRGVEFHRNNIRMKLGLKNKKVNLRSCLLSFEWS